MARSHGRCRRGERLRMGFPHGHRKTTILVAGLRKTGMVAPMTLDGPINGDWFEAYVRHVLIPTLRSGDVVVMDNLSSHKRASVREMLEAVGARLLFLPPYSPDFNPIEMAFAKLKSLLRRAAERTINGLWSAIRKLVASFSISKCDTGIPVRLWERDTIIFHWKSAANCAAIFFLVAASVRRLLACSSSTKSAGPAMNSRLSASTIARTSIGTEAVHR